MTRPTPKEGGSGSSRRRSDTAHASALELDPTTISQLLDRLDERLRRRGVRASLYIVGGAAVVAVTGSRRVTRDVDVAYLDPVVAEAASALALEEGLPADWLSSAAGAWAPPGLRPSPSAAEPGPEAGLTVRYASVEQLLAMKMLALRSRDLAG